MAASVIAIYFQLDGQSSMMNSNLPVQRNLLEQMHAALTVAQRALLRDICTHAEPESPSHFFMVSCNIPGGFKSQVQKVQRDAA